MSAPEGEVIDVRIRRRVIGVRARRRVIDIRARRSFIGVRARRWGYRCQDQEEGL